MDLSCEENMQNSGNNSGSGRMVDMCVAGPDRALDRDPRLILNLLTLERAHAIHTDYFQNVQIDIQPFMRKVVTTWMLEVSSIRHLIYYPIIISNIFRVHEQIKTLYKFNTLELDHIVRLSGRS